ncbi:MAG TPA: metal ABC transporter substrate-binding protein, partial [Acidimicrobiia bacterium]|nr:metal ABC transporter substrate-binding protein [Acidimicrobiia bacterium]
MKQGLTWLGTLLLLVAACSIPSNGGETITVVATTTVWGDVVADVVGDDGEVVVLMPVGADAHDFQLSSQQAALLTTADLVVANGLLLEEGMQDALTAAAADGANVLELGEALNPIGIDPHVWMDPTRVARSAGLIAQRLMEVRPEVDWQEQADTYATMLQAADLEIQETLSVVPPEQRKLVTNHEALGYFADRYGFEVVGSVIPGGTTLAQPSSAELAALVATMREEGVTVIFAETIDGTALAEAVASELGEEATVVELFTESLGAPGSGADTVVGMLVTNAHLIADALAG